MSTPKIIKFLITSRDAASANDILEVLLELLKDKRYIIRILAQGVSYSIFFKYLSKIPIKVDRLIEFKIDNKVNCIENILDSFQPDLLLTGISDSSNGSYGVDEIALKAASKYDKKIKTFSIQSYWGDLNNNLEFLAETIFVLDEFAKKETLKRCDNVNIVISGPPQIKKYHEVDVLKKRPEIRKKIQSNGMKIIGFFGQPLFEYSWYRKSLDIFFEEVSNLNISVKILYKPHPKETAESIKWTIGRLKSTQNNFILVHDLNIIDALSATDLAVSLFSTTGYDLQKILSKSLVAFSVPLYLFYEKEYKKWFKESTHLTEIPMSYDNMALVVTHHNKLSLMIRRGLSREFQLLCCQNIKNNFDFKDGIKNIKNFFL